MTALEKPKLSAQEYLVWERQQLEVRHEFVDGEVFAMTGGTYNHSAITSNFAFALGTALHGSPCSVHTHSLRVQQLAERRYVYPDIVVACKPVELRDDDTLLNPRLIVEVLSPSTAAYDRNEKQQYYRAMPSVETLIIVAQDRPYIEVQTRHGQTWHVVEFQSVAETVVLPALGLDIPMLSIYQDVLDTPAA